MKKYKKFHIISVCCFIVVVIFSEVLIYFLAGEDMLNQSGSIRTFSILLPFILGVLTTIVDYSYFKISEKKSGNHKKD